MGSSSPHWFFSKISGSREQPEGIRTVILQGPWILDPKGWGYDHWSVFLLFCVLLVVCKQCVTVYFFLFFFLLMYMSHPLFLELSCPVSLRDTCWCLPVEMVYLSAPHSAGWGKLQKWPSVLGALKPKGCLDPVTLVRVLWGPLLSAVHLLTVVGYKVHDLEVPRVLGFPESDYTSELPGKL